MTRPATHNAVAQGASYDFVPLSSWMPAIKVKNIKTLMQLGDATPNFDVIAAYQTAPTDTDTPDSWTTIGSALTNDGKNCSGMVDISTALASKFFVRFGIGVKVTSGTNLERGEVGLVVSGRSS